VLAPTRLANDVVASVLTRSDNAATQLADAQSERKATASQLGKSQGEAPPPPVVHAPVPTFKFFVRFLIIIQLPLT
jgi:hypothetical protein